MNKQEFQFEMEKLLLEYVELRQRFYNGQAAMKFMRTADPEFFAPAIESAERLHQETMKQLRDNVRARVELQSKFFGDEENG